MLTKKISVESPEEKRARHARKETNLRLSLRGNTPLRISLLKKITRSFARDNSFREFEKEIERLFSYPENYLGCELNYNLLFDRVKLSNNNFLMDITETFKSELTQEGYLKSNFEIIKNKKNY